MSPTYSEDLTVVQAYLNGDRKIEKALYDQLNQLISSLLRSMEGKGCRFADRDNLVSDIVYQVLVADDRKVMQAFRGDCKLSTYLWPIVRNKIIDAGRREKRQREKVVFQEEYDPNISETPNQPGVVELEIKEHLDQQSPVERFVKLAKWMEGLSYEEIIVQTETRFPNDPALNSQRIAYILHSNRKVLQKKLKKSGFRFD